MAEDEAVESWKDEALKKAVESWEERVAREKQERAERERAKAAEVQERFELMSPVFSAWAQGHGLADTIARFREVMAESLILKMVEDFDNKGAK